MMRVVTQLGHPCGPPEVERSEGTHNNQIEEMSTMAPTTSGGDCGLLPLFDWSGQC